MLRKAYEDALYSITVADTFESFHYYIGYSSGLLSAMLLTGEIELEEYDHLFSDRSVLINSVKAIMRRNENV